MAEKETVAKEVKLPDVGEGVTEGELVKWLVKVGDTLEEDQPIAEVMTDKATVEVPSPFRGRVKELKVKEGDIIPIESVMMRVDTESATAAVNKAATQSTSQPTSQSATQHAPAAPIGSTQPTVASATNGRGLDGVHPAVADNHVLATPSTRRLAREMNVDINGTLGTGLAGRVTRDDVLKSKDMTEGAATRGLSPSYLPLPPQPYYGPTGGAMEERVPLRGIRRKIAKQMQMTKQVVPHFTLMDEVNVTSLVRVRAQAKAIGESYGIKVTFLPFIIKALIATLREFPMLNASIDDAASEVVYKKYFNIGFAVDTPQGLLVPVIKNADQKTILQMSQEINELAKKARDGQLSLDEMKGATITITNIGSIGGTYATPIINHPEVGILGVYKITDKPIMRDGKFRAAKVQNYTVTCDHRLIDGAVAANFLKAFLSRIENPSRLLLDMM